VTADNPTVSVCYNDSSAVVFTCVTNNGFLSWTDQNSDNGFTYNLMSVINSSRTLGIFETRLIFRQNIQLTSTATSNGPYTDDASISCDDGQTTSVATINLLKG
jgi:hypothetical protein